MTNDSKKPPVVDAHMLVRRPAKEVYEAFIDPQITSHFWFTKGSGRLEVGKHFRWDWEMYGASAEVDVKELVPNRRILVDWGGGGVMTHVEWTFEPHGDDQTFVTIKNWGFPGDGDAVVAAALDSMGGFSLLLAGLKAYLEHGIELRLTLDHHPSALKPEWKGR